MDIIKGELQKGRGLASKMGFATINLSYDGEKRGVYAGKFLIEGKEYAAAVHVGPRPTVNDENVVCEVFLLDGFVEVFSGQYEVRLVEKVREVMSFESLDELKRQVMSDIKAIKKILCVM